MRAYWQLHGGVDCTVRYPREPTTRPEKATLAHCTCLIPMMVNSCLHTPTFSPPCPWALWDTGVACSDGWGVWEAPSIPHPLTSAFLWEGPGGICRSHLTESLHSFTQAGCQGDPTMEPPGHSSCEGRSALGYRLWQQGQHRALTVLSPRIAASLKNHPLIL